MLRNIQRDIMKKKVAEYQRTSSGGQDLKLQAETNKEYMHDIPDDEKLPFVDYDVSATKRSIDNRPALSRMLKLIEDGVISRVVVYERDRLARNVYEYIYIVKKFYKHEVEVTFTASDAPPFSQDLFLETWYGLSAQFEGKRISSRLSDARKRNPASLIGYIKQKVNKENGTSQRIYKADQKVSKDLSQLFFAFSKVDRLEDIFKLIMKYHDLLNRNELRIIDILRTPFYSAHLEAVDGVFHKLPNVEPIISLDLFKKVQEKLAKFEHGLQQGISLSQRMARVAPICANCHKELKFKRGKIGTSGNYHCPKHRKSSISSSELNETIMESVKDVLNEISPDSINKVALKAVSNQIKDLNKQSDELFSQLEQLCLKFTGLFKPTDHLKQTEKLQKQIEQVREKLSITQTNIHALQLVKDELRLIIERVQYDLQHLGEKDYFELADLLIESIQIKEDYVLLNYYLNDFFKETEDAVHVTNK